MQNRTTLLDNILNNPEQDDIFSTDDIIHYCNEHILEFLNCIRTLLQDYHVILQKSDLIQNEYEINNLGNYINNKVMEFGNQLKQDMNLLIERAKLSTLILSAKNNAIAKNKQFSQIERAVEEKKEYINALQKSLVTITEEKIKQTIELELKQTENELISANKVFENTKKVAEEANIKVDELLIDLKNIELTSKMLNDDSVKNIYQPSKFQFELFKDNVTPLINNLNQTIKTTIDAMNNQCEGMIQTAEMIGSKNIQKAITTCINIFFQMKSPSMFIGEYYQNYCQIAKTLAEFWYDEGIQLTLEEDLLKPDYNQLYLQRNIELLFYVFLMSPDENTMINLDVYRGILNYLNPDDKITMPRDVISLETIAKNKPEQFIKLIEYFSSLSGLKAFLHRKKEENINVQYHLAIISLLIMNNYEFIKEADIDFQLFTKDVDLAKKQLLKCLNLNLNSAETKLYYYFPDDINLEIDIAMNYFEINKKYEISQRIYKKIYSKDYKEFANLNNILTLFRFWILQNDHKELKEFASKYIEYSAAQGDELAYSILEEVASQDSSYVDTLVRIALASGDVNKNKDAYELLMDTDQTADIQYLIYLMNKEHFKSFKKWHYVALIESANKGYEPSIHEVKSLIEVDFSANNQVLILLFSTLEEFLGFSLFYIIELYISGKLQVVHLNLEENVLNQFINIFYRSFIKTADEDQRTKAINELQYFAERDNTRALELLDKYSQNYFNVLVFLVEYYASKQIKKPTDEISKKLVELNQTLALRYTELESAEKSYCLFILNYEIDKKFNLNLLFSACQQGYDTAIQHLIRIVEEYNTSLYEYKLFDIKSCVEQLELLPRIDTSTALCMYYAGENNWESSTQVFIELCLKREDETIIKVVKALKSYNLLSEFMKNCDSEYHSFIPKEYLLSKEESHFLAFQEKRDQENCIDLDLLFAACTHECKSAICELNDLIYNKELNKYNLIINSEFYDITSDTTAYIIDNCVNKLHEFATSKGVSQIYSAQSLCLYCVKNGLYVGANYYFNICFLQNVRSINVLCDRLKNHNILKKFLNNCSNEVLEQIPNSYKISTYPGQKRLDILSKIRFFDQNGKDSENDDNEKVHNAQYKK